MKKAYVGILAIVVISAIAGVTFFQFQDTKSVELKVYCAGSLVYPFKRSVDLTIEEKFEKQHPNVDVQIEGHGSIQCIRHVIIPEIGHKADVVAVADYSLIPLLMYNTEIYDTGENYADWNIKFARNELGIAYTKQSDYADEINESNWYKILSRDDVDVGISDPRLDACGYRVLMALQLAEKYYENNRIADDLLFDEFTNPITVMENQGTQIIRVPEILKPPTQSRIAVRGSSIALLQYLETEYADYAFEYKSVARQHDLEFVELPDRINLSSEKYENFYNKVEVRNKYQRYASVKPVFACRPIIYGITIPNNAPHPDMAAEFVKFVVSSEGQEVLQRENQPPIIPPLPENFEKMPQGIQDFFEDM